MGRLSEGIRAELAGLTWDICAKAILELDAEPTVPAQECKSCAALHRFHNNQDAQPAEPEQRYWGDESEDRMGSGDSRVVEPAPKDKCEHPQLKEYTEVYWCVGEHWICPDCEQRLVLIWAPEEQA